MNMPSLEKINELSDRHASLLLLRVLMASDGLTSQYELYEKRTVQDIIDVAEGLLEASDVNYGSLKAEETTEYLSHLDKMKSYTGG